VKSKWTVSNKRTTDGSGNYIFSGVVASSSEVLTKGDAFAYVTNEVGL
jgi:hypothetical protein